MATFEAIATRFLFLCEKVDVSFEGRRMLLRWPFTALKVVFFPFCLNKLRWLMMITEELDLYLKGLLYRKEWMYVFGLRSRRLMCLCAYFCRFKFGFTLYKLYSLFTINGSCSFVVSYIVNSLALETRGLEIFGLQNCPNFVIKRSHCKTYK